MRMNVGSQKNVDKNEIRNKSIRGRLETTDKKTGDD